MTVNGASSSSATPGARIVEPIGGPRVSVRHWALEGRRQTEASRRPASEPWRLPSEAFSPLCAHERGYPT